MSASSGDMSSTVKTRTVLLGRRSAHRITSAPAMKDVATTVGVKRCALTALPTRRPITTAGKNAISTFSTNRRARDESPSAAAVSTRRRQKNRITAKMAPVWIAMSNTLAFSLVKSSSDPARIRCPVDEIGRNSVNPSTIPMIAALTSNNISMCVPVWFFDWCEFARAHASSQAALCRGLLRRCLVTSVYLA